MAQDTGKFFDEKVSAGYDERVRKMGAINDNIHLLIWLILQDLPEDARILCVGVGTGNEIVYLAEKFPGWHFHGIDPSAPMLDACRKKLRENGIESRAVLSQGYLSEIDTGAPFDAALCLLVSHFILDDAERQGLFADMHGRLKPKAYLIHSDISFDQSSPDYDEILKAWKNMHRLAGATPEQADNITQMLRTHVAVRAPEAIEEMLRRSGFPLPVRFFQSLLIHAWYSQKP